MSTKNARILRDYMREHQLTQTDLAKKFELSRHSIHKYLKGTNIAPFIRRRIEVLSDGELKASFFD